jgi:hypothetical protein
MGRSAVVRNRQKHSQTRKANSWTLVRVTLFAPATRRHSFSTCLYTNLYYPITTGSSVGIANGYGLDGPGIESRWGARFFAPVQTGPGAHPASCTMGTGSFSGIKSGRGVTLTPHPLLVPWSRNGRAIPLLPPMGRTACTEPQCLYRSALYILLYLLHNKHLQSNY